MDLRDLRPEVIDKDQPIRRLGSITSAQIFEASDIQ